MICTEREYELSLAKMLNADFYCGCDEAGRGPLAGRVYAAAVILPEDCDLSLLNDSKKLSEKKRDEAAKYIKEIAVDYSVAYCTVAEIEEMNILKASLFAMEKAATSMHRLPKAALIDGNINADLPFPSLPVIKGDALCPSIAAASILAKTERDKYCLYLDSLYPEYGFAKHKGYGTKAHFEAIEKYGPCPEHRISFLKKRFPGIEKKVIGK